MTAMTAYASTILQETFSKRFAVRQQSSRMTSGSSMRRLYGHLSPMRLGIGSLNSWLRDVVSCG